MSVVGRTGRRVDRFIAGYTDRDLPEPAGLPHYVAPLPEWLENVGLRLAWPIAIINLVGTAFGFWYYGPQLEATPTYLWPLIPVSPLATMFIGLSLIAWRLDLDLQWLHVVAFFGCIKLGLWTPYVQLFLQSPAGIPDWLYWFLVTSHLAMVLEAFIIHRYADFSVRAVLVATGWYTVNDVLDYFVPVEGAYTHTWLRAERVNGAIDHGLAAHESAAAAAVVLTIACVFFALATRVEKERVGEAG